MEKEDSIGAGIALKPSWCWAAASAAQLGWGIWMYRRGYAGDCNFMPLKAFSVASLFVGAAATAGVASLRGYGVESVEDMVALGANIRTGLGLRTRDKKAVHVDG